MAANPDLFRQMSQPFEDVKAADAAAQAFFEEFGELRKKHKMTNAYVIVGGEYRTGEQDEEKREAQFILSGMYGNQLMAETLTAWAFGQESAKRQERIAELVAEAASMKRLRSKK